MDGKFKIQNLENMEAGPKLMDVISIDGRWGQMIATQMGENPAFIIWIDGPNPSSQEIDLRKYKLTERIGLHIGSLKDQFNQGQIDRVHWGPEEVKHPELRLQVRVFGKYIKAD